MKMVVELVDRKTGKVIQFKEGKSVESAGSERLFLLLTYAAALCHCSCSSDTFVSVVTPSPRRGVSRTSEGEQKLKGKKGKKEKKRKRKKRKHFARPC